MTEALAALAALGKHIERGYIYFAMAFSLFVEILNLRLRPTAEPVPLRLPAFPEKTQARQPNPSRGEEQQSGH